MIYGNKYLSEDDSRIIEESNLASDPRNSLIINNERYKISVYDNEGPIPHCHIYGSKMNGCVKLLEPEYFNHEPHMNLKLDSKGAKELYKWMKAIYNGKRNWNRLVDEWNKNESHYHIPDNIDIPDYTKLNR